MLDPRSPGDPTGGATALKRERSGLRKILTIPQLAELRERLHDKRIVLCHGAFDLVHMGHVLHFEEAASLGDVLVVTITGDKHITKKRSVSFSEEYRARQVAALEIVDFVAIVNEPSAVPAIEALRPDVYVKGSEYSNLVLDKTANIFREKRLIESYGGRIHFTTGETFSSTKLSHFLRAAPEASQIRRARQYAARPRQARGRRRLASCAAATCGAERTFAASRRRCVPLRRTAPQQRTREPSQSAGDRGAPVRRRIRSRASRGRRANGGTPRRAHPRPT